MRAKKDKAGSDDEVVSIIHSHHLLDHKPDNMILSGKKFKLRGIACLGRPGVALCIGSQRNISKFMQKLKAAMPQKKFSTIHIETDVAIDSTTLNEIRDGFQKSTLTELRDVLTEIGKEDEFYKLVGVENNNSNNSQSQSLEKKKRRK